MSEHTPGKLEVAVQVFDNDGCPETVIQGMGGAASVAVALDFGSNNPGMREANARRLAACWNALDGLSQDALDGGWNFKDADAYTVRIEKERESLRAVNAGLIKALERSADALDRLTDKVDGTGFSSSDEFNNALDEIDLGRAAIASARKQGEQA